MAEDNLQYDTEQPEIQVADQPEQQGPGDPPSKVLWEKMVKNKRYSFSYDDFQKEYNSKEAVAQLHKDLRGVGAKVAPINDFYAKYFPDLAGAKSSTTKLAPQVFEKPITSQQYAPMDGIPAYGSPEYKKIKAAEAEKQALFLFKQVAQRRAFQEFETAYDKFNIAKKNVENGNDPDKQGVLPNGKPYSKAIGGKGVIENVSDFIIADIVPSEAVKQERERSRMQSKLLSYSSANEEALKTAQVYIDDFTNVALKGYPRLSKISSVDGVYTPDPIKIRQYINNRAESAGFRKDGPVYDILNSKITAGVEYAIKKPTIEKNANEISKKETGKSIQELVSAEQQAIIQSAADINSKAKLQAETLAKKTIAANKAEAQGLFNTKYKPLYDKRNAISEQAASAFEKQFAHLIKDGKFIGSPQEYEMYNQQLAALQAIDDENKALTDSWSKELFKEQGRIASKYNKQYTAGVSALEASTKKELAKKNDELKAFKVSPGLLAKINRYYEDAYKKTVTDEDAAKAPKGFLQTLSAFDSMFTHNFLDAMANYAGRMGLKGIESVFAAGANEFNPQQIEMNKFSDFLSPYKVIGSGATMGGRMGPAIAAGAIIGAVTKSPGTAFRAFMAGATEWLTENTDNAHSTYKDVLAETGDPAKAENAAQKQYEAGMINLPLYGLGWMPFFSKSFNKLPLAAKIVAGTAIETGTELPTEFSQTLQEESIKETGDWKNMLDYASWEKAKNTFYNIVPLSLAMGGGGHVVTHFADKVTYNQKVDALVQATEIGGASASQQDQYAFNLVKIGDTKLAKAVLVGLHQSGHITDKELNRLNATVDKAKSITESAEKLGMNEGEQRIYAALNYQFEEAKANMATEKDPIAREAWKLKAANAQQNITNFAATKQGDYAIVTYADGGQSVFSHEEINNALSTPVVAKSLKKGTLKIEVFGKEKEALAEKIKQTTEAEKKSTASPSVADDETENGNDDFSVEKVEAADGITHYLPTSSTSGYFKDEQGEDISFTTEQEAKDFLSKQPKAQVPTLSTQSKKETLTKEQDEAKQRVATFIDNTVSLPTTDATLREKLGNDPKAALQELIDFHEQQKSGKDEKTQVFHQKAIDKFEALKNDIDLISQQPQKSAETQKHDGSKSKDVESAIDGGKSQQPGQLQQNEVEIPNTPEASQLDEERKKAIAPLQAVAGGKATHTIQLPQRGKNTATILQNGREAGSIILTPEEQSLNDQKEAGREAGLVTDEEYNEWHKGFTAKVAARAIDATNKQYAKKQEALVNNPPSFLQRVKNLDLEAITDPIGRVLKYFALGGKINTNFVKEQYGGKDERIRQSTSTEEQRRSMFSLLAKDAPNIEELAEQLEAEANQHNDGNSRLDTRDYVSAIEEVLSSHQSPASAAKELWEKYSPEATEAEIAKLWEQKGGSQTQEESAPMEETEVRQPLTINGEEISFSADNSNPQTASQEPKLLTPNDPKFKRLQKAINRFLSKIKGYSTEVLHGQDFQKLVDWAKRQQDVKMMAGRKPVGGNSGYVGYSMSRRAAQAYDDGKQIFETEESDKEPKYFRRPNGTIYGIKVGTKIYLNGDKLNLETPAHEAGHIFRDWAKENAPDLYKAATKLMSRPNKYREMVLANETYKEQIRQMKANGATAEQINEFIADEALAHMIGDRAAKIVENRSQFVQWLKDLWESIKLSMPGAKDFENKTLSDFYKMTWEQFGNAATERILSGRALETRQSKNSSTSSAPQYMTLPDGRKAKLLPEVTNGFYSPIEKKLLDEKAENLSANKWLERLGKGDEMVWTGLKDFLESKKPNEQVKKSELQAFMKDNRIEVVEVVKEQKKELDRDNLAMEAYGKSFDELTEAEKDNIHSAWEDSFKPDNTKYSKYQLEGDKSNYKEVLVTMPSIDRSIPNMVDVGNGKYYLEFGNGNRLFGTYTKSEAESVIARRKSQGQKSSEVKFSSSHFDEPNILVHLRMNTRTDAEGKKVLFLEEVQSDWGQKGKKEGFKQELVAKKSEDGRGFVVYTKEGKRVNHFPNAKTAEDAIEYTKEDTSDNSAFNTPTAPFVTETPSWTKLALKVALKEAVKQNASVVAWTTGEQQNERYDLSKQVDEIGWQKNENGTYNITPKKDGSVVGTRDMMANLTLKQVEDYVGKDIAEKIQNDEGKVWEGGNVKQGKLTGQQLKVGGKGMKGFYGSPSEGTLGIVGNVAKSLWKQEPKTIDVFQSDKLASGWSVTTKDINGNVQTNMFDSKSKGLAWLSKQEELEVLSEDAEGKNYTTQHSITITPEMREQVQEGQPLFMAENALYLDDSELIKDKDGNVTGIKPEVAEAIRKERNRIEAEAKANGTYHKAPNGKPSKLTESQWVTVRTERFKRWFGDWESAADLLNLGLTESEIIKNLKIKNYATEVIANRKEIRRLSQEAERGRKRGGIRNVEATIILETGGKRNGQITGRENQPNPLNDVSKVVDENGEPLVVYHGSPNGVFTVFDLSKRGTRSTGAYNESRALHFTDNLKTAIAYSESYKNKPVKYTVNGVEKIINPTDTRPSAKEYEVFLNIRNAEDVGASRNITKEKITDAIKSGFDGIFADMGNGREFVAFNPNQIKSATGNAGTFSNETGDIRFMASGISNSNTNFIEDEKTKYYTTSEGEKIPYRVYDTGSKKDGNNASTNLLQRQENTEQGNDFALVERQFTEYKQLDFTAGTKIESLNDVAWLFHNLEDESVEHSFAVYIMPNGSYVVQHLSTGGIASTVIDGRLVSGNAVKMGAKSVAFVHNHPSGALRASDADMHVYSKLKKSLEGTGIDLQDGVIINLKSGKYVTFDAQSNAVNNITKQNQEQHKVQVLSFSKQVFAENYNPDKITGYSDVAMLLSTKKFGVSDKTEMLVLNNALEVVGKFVLPENNQYAKIIELLTQYGGVNAILYGNKINAEEVNDYNRRLVSIGFKILDAIEVKSDNYKSLVSEGLINEDQPLYESNSPSNTDNHEAAKKKTQGNRIEKSPLPVGKRKEIRHIIRDFKNAAKTRIFYTKVGRRAAGTYNSSEGAIRLRYAGDLDTTAHEAGHDIDDRYKVIEAILKNPAARAELVPFVASPAASKPPKGHPNPQNYLQREGFAEWLRAFIVNPDEAKAQAPEIYKIYEAQVHDNMKKAVHHLSNDVRTFAGLEGIDQLLSNVELTPETKSFFDRFKDKNHEGVFHISWVDKIKINMLNSLQAFDKAWNIAKGLKGIDEVLPENDPTILVRLLYGFDGKFGDILETGMINSKNEVLEDANGNAKNLDWLLEPLDRYNEKTIKKEQEYTIAFMVAERTLELSKRFGRESILSGIGGGLFKDIETAQAALDEINALPPAQKARIEEAARRYREFANDILLYMVDKGRLSQEQYDAIKKENVQYVAMQRIIDQEPGTELEVFTMNGNSIGSVAKPVHNIQGSSRTIINPYSSLLDGLYRSIKEADRNEILVAFTDMVSHVRSMGDGEVIPFSDIAIKAKPGDKNTQVVYRNGKPEYWKFQQDIHEAIKGLNEEAEGLLMKYGKIPGTILRETITKFPVFAARNFIRDTQDRIIKSIDSNLLDLVGNSAHWKDIARFGGLNSGFYMRDRASYYGLMKESMRRLAKNKNTIVLSGEGMKRVWDRYEKALQTSETINRVAEYRGAFREAKKKGMDDYNAGLYAASRARNLIDFAEAGVIMRQLNKLIPFSNAAVQGMRSAVNRAIEDPGGFAIRTGVYSVLPAVMLWMWNHRKDDDDDKENEYENLPAYQRDMYHNLKIGKNKWLSIPKPYELSLVSSGIDRGMSLFFGKNKNAFQGYGGTVIQSVMPLDESSMFGPFRPIYEGISNYDVFRQKNIVPIYENDLDLSLRHTETASLLGQWLQSASNIDARKIDHFIQGQFGYFGKAAMKLSNINREDGGRSFDITDLSFFKESPGYNSPDVQNLLNYAKRWGLTQNIDFKDIKALNQAIFDAKTDEEKEAAKKELITHSRLLLLQWKAEDKAKQKQDKFTEKQDTKSD